MARLPTGDSGGAGGDQRPPKDVIFDLLSVKRRREVLRYRDEHDGQASVGELAEHIAAEENGLEASEITSPQRKGVYIGLYHSHLPRLGDAGVIDYNQERGYVALTDTSRWIFPHLYLEPTPVRSGSKGEGRIRPILRRVHCLIQCLLR